MKVTSYDLMPHIEDLLNEGKVCSFKVKGVSMWPFYKDNKTTVTLKKDTYQKHDVVLFKYESRYVLHRIIKIKDNEVTLQGDGAILKEVINEKQIIGKVISHELTKKVSESSKIYRLKVTLFKVLPFRRFIIKVFR